MSHLFPTTPSESLFVNFASKRFAMRPVIEFSECLFDSPKFRSQLSKNETNLDDLETKLEKILKLSNSMTEIGRQFINCQGQFVIGLWELRYNSNSLHSGMFPEVLFRFENVGRQDDFAVF